MRKPIQIVCVILGFLFIACSTSGRLISLKIPVIIPPKEGEHSDAVLIGNEPQLRYPKKALAQGRTGVVQLEFTVDTNGKTTNIKILKEEPEGFGFGTSSIECVRKLLFRPAVLNGVFVKQNMIRKFNFQL